MGKEKVKAVGERGGERGEWEVVREERGLNRWFGEEES
jgi:hypothetical protein